MFENNQITQLVTSVPTIQLSSSSNPDCLFAGDEIFSVNGRSVAGLTHSEAIGIFKETKVGSIQVTLGRRETKQKIVQIEGDIHC